jgi:hypothetical protein
VPRAIAGATVGALRTCNSVNYGPRTDRGHDDDVRAARRPCRAALADLARDVTTGATGRPNWHWLLADRIPRARLRILKDSGHLNRTEQPDVDEAISAFLAEAKRADAPR